MASGDRLIDALREAVQAAPKNLALRQHLADALLQAGRAEEAEKEYRQGLALAPDHIPMKLGLATSFYRLGKNSEALVVVEDLLKKSDTPAQALVLHARLLIRAGDVELAVRQYRRALDADPTAADPELTEKLGIGSENSAVNEGRVRASPEEAPAFTDDSIERPKTTFRDVGGMDAVKEEIRMKIIHPLDHPELYKAYGKSIGGGILLFGPPGCGKTHLARATAGEVKAGFLAIGINDVLDMWIGNSERNLHELFERARSNTPCVLFFDEVDALGANRTDMRASYTRITVNQFLAELDGVKTSNEGVLILAATNAPWHLDPAFRRPGRFDRIVFVPPPDLPARSSILKILLNGKPVDHVDYEALAKKTDHFSGADLKALVDIAVEKKLQAAMKEGVPKPISTKDLAEAIKSVRPSTKEWFATARNYALYSNPGGIYDEILKYLKI